jgi:hypothetical protein
MKTAMHGEECSIMSPPNLPFSHVIRVLAVGLVELKKFCWSNLPQA